MSCMPGKNFSGEMINSLINLVERAEIAACSPKLETESDVEMERRRPMAALPQYHFHGPYPEKE